VTFSVSTEALYRAIRERLLDFEPMTGEPLGLSLGHPDRPRMYFLQAPDEREELDDDGGWPYVTLHLTDMGALPGEQGLRHQFVCTVDVWDYPRENQFRASTICDVAHEAFLFFTRANTLGLMFCRSSDIRRFDAPVAPGPLDRELVHTRLIVPLVVWPAFLTQYAVT
jgi:hypothetical protein